MKDIIASPLFSFFALCIGIIYILILFTYVGRDKKRSLILEQVLAGAFIFTISGATGVGYSIFPKFHPMVLALVGTTMPTICLQLGFYSTCIFILLSRLRYTLKDTIQVLATVIPQNPTLFILFLFTGFSVFWSETPLVTLKTSLVYLAVACVAIYVAKQYTWKDLYKILRFITLMVMILSYQVQLRSSGAWGGVLGHKNQFSFFMALTAASWLFYGIYNPKHRRISIVIFLFALYALNQAASGAGKVLIVVLLSLWQYLGFAKKLSPRWAFVSIILFMIVSICLTIVISENIEFIVVDTLHKDMTLTGRLDFWPLILKKIDARPLLGYGVAGFWQFWRGVGNPAMDIIVVKTQFRPPHSHNGFLDMALELGYTGVILYAITFFNNLAKGVIYLTRNRLPEAGLPILLLVYMVMTNITETGLFGATSNWFWFVVITVRLAIDNTEVSRKQEV